MLECRGPFDCFMHRLFLRQKRNEQTGVAEPHRLRRLWRYDMAIFLVLMIALMGVSFTPPGEWLHVVIGAVVGSIVGINLFRTLHRARAYQRGWLDGRKQMVASMEEAMRRRMDIEDWLQGELERDFHVMRHL